MVRTKIFVKEDTKMLYTEKEKHEIERVKEVFAEHLRQSPDFELLWSDKVGYVWLAIGVNPVYVDTGIRIESAADLCYRCLDDVATDVLYMTGNDHALEAADPLELRKIKRALGGSTRSEGLSLKDVDRINDELPTEGGGPSSPDGGIVENPLG